MSAPGHVMEVPRVRVSGHSVAGEVYPDLVDGRVENDSAGAISRQAVIAGSRASRRSHSLLPENAALVRRAHLNMSRRRRGFTAVVLGEIQGDTHDLEAAFGHDSPQTPMNKHPAIAQRRASAHKLLAVTKSDPMMGQAKQCVSCIGHPEYCLSALGLHDACPAHSSLLKTASTPRRSHSLRAHAYKMTSNLNLKARSSSVKAKKKSDKISEEGECLAGCSASSAPSSSPIVQRPTLGRSPASTTPSGEPRTEAGSHRLLLKEQDASPFGRGTRKPVANAGVRRKMGESMAEGPVPRALGDKENGENLQKMMDCMRRVSI